MMRLTLRALLLHRAGFGKAAELKQLGERIASHATARQVNARIEQLLEHPADDLTSESRRPDAIAAAAYLSNDLPLGSVTQFERQCLDSDIWLSEIAACNEIIAEYMSGPPILNAPLQNRLYQLGKLK